MKETREKRRTNMNVWYWIIGILVVIGLIWWWWSTAANNDADMREPVERGMEGMGNYYLQEAPENQPALFPAFSQV